MDSSRASRPWLGANSNEPCTEQARLLIRTASNAYFPQVLSVLSLPEHDSAVDTVVAELWDDLSAVDDASDLKVFKKKPLSQQSSHRDRALVVPVLGVEDAAFFASVALGTATL